MCLLCEILESPASHTEEDLNRAVESLQRSVERFLSARRILEHQMAIATERMAILGAALQDWADILLEEEIQQLLRFDLD